MLEGEKIELSKHLEELSLKNDQVLHFYQLRSTLASGSQISYSFANEIYRRSMKSVRNMNLKRQKLLMPKKKRQVSFYFRFFLCQMSRMLKLFLCHIFYECLEIQAEKLIREIENKCNEKISQNKYDSERYLIWLNEEHGTMVS